MTAAVGDGLGDVLIIGGGIAGFSAALAVRSAGRKATLLRGPVSGSELGGALWNSPAEVASEPEKIVLRALGIYREAGAYSVVTPGGVRAGTSAQKHALDIAKGSRLVVAQWSGRDRYDVKRSIGDVARVVATIDIGRASDNHATFAARAQSDINDLAQSLAGAVKSAHAEADAVLFPPVLPNDLALVSALSERLGKPVGETSEALSAVQGLRLRDAMTAALHAAQVTLIDVTSARLDRSAPAGSRASGTFRVGITEGGDNRQREVQAARVVLATGKLFAGGISTDEGRMHETVADLDVFLGTDTAAFTAQPSQAMGRDPESNFGMRAFSSAPAWVSGVLVDAGHRVLDRHRTVVHPRLFAAGALLAGIDARFATLGESARSGWAAGQQASSS